MFVPSDRAGAGLMLVVAGVMIVGHGGLPWLLGGVAVIGWGAFEIVKGYRESRK